VKSKLLQNWKFNIPENLQRKGKYSGGLCLPTLGMEVSAFCSLPEILKPDILQKNENAQNEKLNIPMSSLD